MSERFSEYSAENLTDEEIEVLRQEAAEWWARPEVVAETERLQKLAETGIRGTALDPEDLLRRLRIGRLPTTPDDTK